MKKIVLSAMLLISSVVQADCANMPVGTELAKSIEAKEVEKAKKLLLQYKEDVKKYLAKCDQSQEKFEETSVMIHTYEARLKDVEYDLNKKDHGVDCSKVPEHTKLDAAFKAKDSAGIKAEYANYKKAAADYLEHCASHAEYETVYESSMFYDEEYAGLGL
jgi:hypothetical protein